MCTTYNNFGITIYSSQLCSSTDKTMLFIHTFVLFLLTWIIHRIFNSYDYNLMKALSQMFYILSIFMLFLLFVVLLKKTKYSDDDKITIWQPIQPV